MTPDEWADKILEELKNYKKKDTTLEVSRYGFNIKEEAIKLEKKYFELLKSLK